MQLPAIVTAFLGSSAVVGFVAGSALTFWSQEVKRDVVRLWHAVCAFGHRMHIKQTTMDDRAIDLLDRARPAIDAAMDQARAGLVAERATAAAMEADQTPQSGSLMPTKVDAEPLPPIAAAVAVEAAPAAPGTPTITVGTIAVVAAP